MNTMRLMELSELTTLALGGNKTRMLYSPSTVKDDFKKLEMVCFLSALWGWYQVTLWGFGFLISVLVAFAVSYTKFVENILTKTLQNFCCQIEVSLIAEYFLTGKSWNFSHIYVRSLELPNYTMMIFIS